METLLAREVFDWVQFADLLAMMSTLWTLLITQDCCVTKLRIGLDLPFLFAAGMWKRKLEAEAVEVVEAVHFCGINFFKIRRFQIFKLATTVG